MSDGEFLVICIVTWYLVAYAVMRLAPKRVDIRHLDSFSRFCIWVISPAVVLLYILFTIVDALFPVKK